VSSIRTIIASALVAAATTDLSAREIKPVPTPLIAQADEGETKVWHTTHFRIESDVELAPADLANLAQVAESTAAVLRTHPLPLFAPPLKGRPRIAIHGDGAAYLRAGGAPGSSGFYVGNTRGTPSVIIRAAALFSRPEVRSSRLDPKHNEDLLVHELVHLCMHRANSGIPQWLAEGLAEYFASAHQGGGRFSFSNMDAAVRDHLLVRFNPKDPRVPLARIATIATLDSSQWLDHINDLPESRRYHAYSCALLLTHYYLHGGSERLDQLRELLEKAPSHRRPPPFFNIEDATSVESALSRFWQPKGLTPVFSE
jgi:hypothetical protein